MSEINNNQYDSSFSFDETFLIVPRYVSNYPGMTLDYLKVYNVFFCNRENNPVKPLSIEQISYYSEVSIAKAKKAIVFLESSGFINIKNSKYGTFIVERFSGEVFK